jgi:hypothetical protein
LGRHDPKACQRATGRAWAEEKIHRAISARPDVPPVPRGHDPKQHEARERHGPSPTSNSEWEYAWEFGVYDGETKFKRALMISDP